MPKIDLEQIYHAYTLDENDKSRVEYKTKYNQENSYLMQDTVKVFVQVTLLSMHKDMERRMDIIGKT